MSVFAHGPKSGPLASPPPCGEGQGWGSGGASSAVDTHCPTPTPNPSPQGGGESRGIAEHVIRQAAAGMLAFGLTLASAVPTHAVEPDEMLKDPALEARARTVSAELRCLVCQNESIDESHAPLAHDIRMLVRQRLEAGDSNQQVVDYLVARYGQFILLKPPFEAQTLLLWGTPLLVIVAGGIAIAVAARRRPTRDPARPLTDTERRKLEELVGPPA